MRSPGGCGTQNGAFNSSQGAGNVRIIAVMNLVNTASVIITQRKEFVELLGFETRNKYEIFDEHKNRIGFCAEQQKGLLGILFRQVLGHWRSFEIHFFNDRREEVFRTIHPFRFIFQEFEVLDKSNRSIGTIKQRFAILQKKFDVLSASGALLFEMRSGFFQFWTFPFFSSNGEERAVIKKKWSGLLKEAFMDADNFAVEYKDSKLSQDERTLILAAGVFTDLQYFENKGN